MLEGFPNSKVKIKYNRYNINKSLQKINFENLKGNPNYKKLVLIYSIIQDSFELINDINENDLNIIFTYNNLHKDTPLIIKKNIFLFFMRKTDKAINFKYIFQYSESIPLLFKNLLDSGITKK